MLSINPSEVVWTILGFLALYFLLKRFLFEPLIRVMDERKAGVEAKKDEQRKALAQTEADEEELDRRRRELAQESAEELAAEKRRQEASRGETAALLRAEAEKAADEAKAEAEALRGQTTGRLDAHGKELAEELALHLLNEGNRQS
ncbi:MAG: hypothetical protein K6G17_02735 [Oscillospiraceae bacterium]|nr:hypothetical protein [Oscillospiraceae bacterium]